ncbi:hypothetical protein ACTLIZ_002009, partial [Cronobacter turicensis]
MRNPVFLHDLFFCYEYVLVCHWRVRFAYPPYGFHCQLWLGGCVSLTRPTVSIANSGSAGALRLPAL